MSLLTFSCSSKAQKQTTDTGMQSDKKILVAYFSCNRTAAGSGKWNDGLTGEVIFLKKCFIRVSSLTDSSMS